MNAACTQPISWLLLERHALGELPGRDVASHLDGCEACRAALELIERDRDRALPPLPDLTLARAARRRRQLRALVAGSGVMLTAAAALLLMWRGRDQLVAGVKGGEVSISLVRERDGDIEHEPADFRPGDRFKVLVTCSVSGSIPAQVTVRQGGATARPLPAASIACGNRVALPGAFRLTGSEPAAICVDVGGAADCAFLTSR
jgi:hypothetical protein